MTLRPGSYLQLKPLKFHDVPDHPDFSRPETDSDEKIHNVGNHPPLSDFLGTIFRETSLGDWDVWKWQKAGNPYTCKRFPGLSAGVVVAVEKRNKTIGREVWCARTSRHGDQEPCKWEALDEVLRKNHSFHEARYTPTIFDTAEVTRWDVDDGAVDGWEHVEMSSKL